jgi:anti-anti-sigma factor
MPRLTNTAEPPGREQSWVAREALPGGGSLVRFGGDLDLSSSRLMTDSLDEAAADGGPIVVDLALCSFIDSTGLAALIHGLRGRNGDSERTLAVIGANPQVRRLFEITRVDSELPLYESQEEALAALEQDSDH